MEQHGISSNDTGWLQTTFSKSVEKPAMSIELRFFFPEKSLKDNDKNGAKTT